MCPIDPNLNVNYTVAQKTSVQTDLTNARTTVETVIVDPLNLSADERQNTPSVDEQRDGYVNDAIVNLADAHPNMVGEAITTARAKNLWEFRNSNMQLLAILDEVRDRLIDSTINAENICLQFTEDMRAKAQRNLNRNVPGATVVWERLKGLHTVTPNPVEEPA
jgi:hypothetical protein